MCSRLVLPLVMTANCASIGPRLPRFILLEDQQTQTCRIQILKDTRTPTCFVAFRCGRGNLVVLDVDLEVCLPTIPAIGTARPDYGE